MFGTLYVILLCGVREEASAREGRPDGRSGGGNGGTHARAPPPDPRSRSPDRRDRRWSRARRLVYVNGVSDRGAMSTAPQTLTADPESGFLTPSTIAGTSRYYHNIIIYGAVDDKLPPPPPPPSSQFIRRPTVVADHVSSSQYKCKTHNTRNTSI